MTTDCISHEAPRGPQSVWGGPNQLKSGSPVIQHPVTLTREIQDTCTPLCAKLTTKDEADAASQTWRSPCNTNAPPPDPRGWPKSVVVCKFCATARHVLHSSHVMQP